MPPSEGGEVAELDAFLEEVEVENEARRDRRFS